MRKIGSFARDGEGFKGSIITLSVQALDVRIVPSGRGAGPSYLVYIGNAAIGAARVLDDQHELGPLKLEQAALALELDDPSFAGPIIAFLVPGVGADTFDLRWQRTE